MKQEEITKYEAERLNEVIKTFSPEEKYYWEIFKDLIPDPEKFQRLMLYQDGLVRFMIRHHTKWVIDQIKNIVEDDIYLHEDFDPELMYDWLDNAVRKELLP